MAEINQNASGQGSLKSINKSSTKIDMTPMVDLGFLLITFFMLTTTLQKPTVLELNMPDIDRINHTNKIPQSSALSIIPWSDGKVYIYRGLPTEPIGLEALNYSSTEFRASLYKNKELIGRDNKGQYKIIALIKPANLASYQNMIDVLDEMAITDIQRYAIVNISHIDEQIVTKYKLNSTKNNVE